MLSASSVADVWTTTDILPTYSTSTCFRFYSMCKGIHTTPQTTISSNPPSMPIYKTKNVIGEGKNLLQKKLGYVNVPLFELKNNKYDM